MKKQLEKISDHLEEISKSDYTLARIADSLEEISYSLRKISDNN